MTRRENALCALRGEATDGIPCYFSSCQAMIPTPIGEGPPPGMSAGFDRYGVHQTATESAGGALTPTPGYPPVIADIENWERDLQLPDSEAVDWEQAAREDRRRRGADPANFVQDLFYTKGLFERFHFLVGFENALCFLLTNPEESYALLEAIADNKIRMIHKLARYYKPDVITLLDDYAHQTGLFLSPDTFRALIKPHLRRIVEAVKSHGILFKMHCCGKMDALAGDFADVGIDALDPIQPINDFGHLRRSLGSRVGLCGGLDMQGIIDRDGVTHEEIRAEVRRCIDLYGGAGGYMPYGVSMGLYNPAYYKPDGKLGIVMDECERYGQTAAG